MANAWLDHVKRTGVENKDVMQKGGFKAILKLAGQTWKKGTGAVSSVGKAAKSVVKGTVKGISKVARTASSTLKMKKKSTRKRKGTKKRKGKKTRGKR